MFLRQKLDERKFLKVKIKELKENILCFTDEQDSLIKHLLTLLDRLQTINLVLSNVNSNSIINIAGSELSLSTAVEVRNTLQSKIDIMNDLIGACEGNLNVMALMEQRDGVIEEFMAIDAAIRQADWNIKIE
jgi:hypothetical protein